MARHKSIRYGPCKIKTLLKQANGAWFQRVMEQVACTGLPSWLFQHTATSPPTKGTMEFTSLLIIGRHLTSNSQANSMTFTMPSSMYTRTQINGELIRREYQWKVEVAVHMSLLAQLCWWLKMRTHTWLNSFIWLILCLMTPYGPVSKISHGGKKLRANLSKVLWRIMQKILKTK